MNIKIVSKDKQGYGTFNGGQIVENKPIGFPQDGGEVKPYSNLFYWAYAEAKVDSTIGLHPHQGFEIMSFVLKGHIRHYDTKLKDWKELKKGDAQIIRAGNGISHAEFMAEGSAMFQIWMDPDLSKTLSIPASYDDYKSSDLPSVEKGGLTIKTYVGENSPFFMHSVGVGIEEWSIDDLETSVSIDSEKTYSIYVLEGALNLAGKPAKKDDFIVLSDANELTLKAEEGTKLFIISSPSKLNYMTYQEIMQRRMAAH